MVRRTQRKLMRDGRTDGPTEGRTVFVVYYCLIEGVLAGTTTSTLIHSVACGKSYSLSQENW